VRVPSGRDIHRTGTRFLSFLMIAIGVVLIVEAAAGGGAARILFGALFVAAGAARIYLATRT
jgi:uncharacterized membrane protein HdeD (DUF308 family)